MALEKFPLSSEIPWNRVSQIRVSSDKNSYSFEFDMQGRKQKMTISVKPDSTSFTLSTSGGSPIVHATQSGREIKVLDFSEKLGLAGASGKLRKMKIVKK